MQYNKLLDNEENPKRKKRTASERDSTGGVVETPVESLVRKLTTDRIVELNKLIPEEQTSLQKLKDEIKELETGLMDDSRVMSMWAEIEEEKRQQEREILEYNQWLKEREEKKIELQKIWRFNKAPVTPPVIKKEEMDVDEPKTPQTPMTPQTPQLQISLQSASQQQHQGTSVTSPLLTSLLKSPSPAPASTTSNARSVAPTITNLLITGSTANLNLSASSLSHSQNPSIQPQPHTTVVFTPQQQISSSNTHSHDSYIPASQQAPTISELLDKKSHIIEPLTLSGPGNNQFTDPDLTSPGGEDEKQLMADLQEMISNPELEEVLRSEAFLEVASLIDEDIKEEPKMEDDIDPFEEENLDDLLGDPKLLNQSIPMDIDKPETPSKNDEKLAIQPAEENKPSIVPAQPAVPTIIVFKEEEVNSPDDIIEEQSPSEPEIVNSVEEPPEVTEIEIITDSDDSNKVPSDDNKPTEVTLKVEEIEVQKPTIEAIQEDTFVEKEEIPKEIPTEIPAESEEEIFMDAKENLDDSAGDKTGNVSASGSPSKTSQIPTLIAIKEEENSVKSTTDSDDDALINMIKDVDSSGKIKKDYSRKKLETETPVKMEKEIEKIKVEKDKDIKEIKEKEIKEIKEEPEGLSSKPSNLSVTFRATRNRDRSESPLVDDDTSDYGMRTGRRLSSTPATDSSSVPNSPASVDDKDYKLWKKSILIAYNRISAHKSASIFQKPASEESHPGYKSVVFRPMDLQTIKKNVENGSIRTTEHFTRDVLLMCTNMMMFAKRNTALYKSSCDLMGDVVGIIDNVMENLKPIPNYSSASSSSSKDNEKQVAKRGNRKSLRNV